MHPLSRMWNAVATADGLAGWWMPNTFQPVVRQAFVLRDRQFGESPCKVEEIIPDKRLSFAWGKDWHLAFELRALGGQTELTLNHSGWIQTS